MGLRRAIRAAVAPGLIPLVVLLTFLGTTPILASPPPVAAAPAQVAFTDEVVALAVEGVGYGHGRGMSQWGSYGWAVNYAKSWKWILGFYYRGTTQSSSSGTARVKVRLVGYDNAAVVGVISTTRAAVWSGGRYSSIQARETAPNRFDIYASSTIRCPTSSTDEWTRVGQGVAGPVLFTTTVNEQQAKPGDVLGLCDTDGSVTHYRGSISVVNDSTNTNRVVNDVRVENYLRGVVSFEVSTSWGDVGGGAGIHALRAQAVAARSYTRSQNRYSYADTCDTTACQAYGGSTGRATATAPVSGGVRCESGNASFECAHTNRAILQTVGVILRWPDQRPVAAEFSASNGPQTAGGVFPSVVDPADNVPSNPNHVWTRVIDARTLAAAYDVGMLTAAVSEPDPTLPYTGIWDNRIRLTGTGGTALVSTSTIRSAFGLPSAGFRVVAYRRQVASSRSMSFIGDSVGFSMTEGPTSELPTLLAGVFVRASYDAVPNRCTAGCGLSGVGAAGSVPIGTGLAVVELGYNNPGTNFASQIDAMMNALAERDVGRVAWLNLNERSGRPEYAAANQALAAATRRWPNLVIIDMRGATMGNGGNRQRWFAGDGIHLTFTGQAEIARYLRDQLLRLA